MRKSIKWLGAFLSILVLLIILTVVCVVTFVSPNYFKPLIAEQVMKSTGRQLTIEGDLSWSLFPNVGIKIGHLFLSNPEGFEHKVFAEIQHATISIKLFPLLHNQIESSGISLDGLKLNLIREANGKNNWQFQQTASAAVPVDSISSSTMQKRSIAWVIAGVSVSNAEVNWTDKQKKQSGSIEKWSLQAKNISFLKPFPVSSEFNFANKNPALSGHVKLTTEASLSVGQQIFSFRDVVLTAQLQQGVKKFNGQLKGNVIADLQQQTLQWTPFYGQMGPLVLTGKIGVTDLTTRPHAIGHFQVQPFDLKELLQSTGQDMTNVQMLKDMSGDIDVTAAENAVDVQGKLTMGVIEAKQIKLSHVVIPLHYQIGILELAPITADFYQGSLQSNVKINLTSAVPQMAMQSTLLNVHMDSLLQDLGGNNQKLKLIGMSNMDLQLTTVGSRSDALVKNLNGTGHISFNQGMLQGMDIGYLIDSAYAVLKHKTLTTVDTKQTAFNSLTASMVFRDGVIVNDDLVLTSPRFKVNGQGHIDLVNQKIDFHLQTVINNIAVDQKNDLGNIYGLPIPIALTGHLKDPTIRLDTAVLVKAVADQQVKKIELKAADQLKSKVHGKAGELLQNLLNH